MYILKIEYVLIKLMITTRMGVTMATVLLFCNLRNEWVHVHCTIMQTDVHKYILYILFYRTEVHVVRNKISCNITYLNLDLEDMICKCIRKII